MFEWLGELTERKPAGAIEIAPVGGGRRPAPAITFVKFVITLVTFAAAPLAAALLVGPGPDPWLGLGVFGGLVLYAFVGTVLRPKPRMDNLGWMGGLIDHPFRISDDWNRGLLGLQLLLLPGRFLGYGVVDMFYLFAGEDLDWNEADPQQHRW